MRGMSLTSRRKTRIKDECDLEDKIQEVVEHNIEDKGKGKPSSFIVKVKIKACTNVTFSN